MWWLPPGRQREAGFPCAGRVVAARSVAENLLWARAGLAPDSWEEGGACRLALGQAALPALLCSVRDRVECGALKSGGGVLPVPSLCAHMCPTGSSAPDAENGPSIPQCPETTLGSAVSVAPSLLAWNGGHGTRVAARAHPVQQSSALWGLWPAGGAAWGHFLPRLIWLGGGVWASDGGSSTGRVGFCCLPVHGHESTLPGQAWLEALGHVPFGSCQCKSQGGCCSDLPLPERHPSPHFTPPCPHRELPGRPRGCACKNTWG